MLRRLHPDQPEAFAFTEANAAWAREQIKKYPPGREASAVIPLLWRAQEQEGWVTKPMIESIARQLGLAEIRVLEVATFYFMFQLSPVGSVAHVQICGTTSCMLCGAEDLIEICKQKIAPKPHQVSEDGKFSWEEVECLGACCNAPMAQIGKDYYEDLTTEGFEGLLAALARGEVPKAGPQNGRFSSEPLGGLTSLTGDAAHPVNASVGLASALGDTVKRIDGSEPTASQVLLGQAPSYALELPTEDVDADPPATDQGPIPDFDGDGVLEGVDEGDKPDLLTEARGGQPDNLKEIKGIGPKLEEMLFGMGVFHFDQIGAWTERELAWVDANLEGFKGRASRDEWVAQARQLAAGETTEFAQRVKDGDVESSKDEGDA